MVEVLGIYPRPEARMKQSNHDRRDIGLSERTGGRVVEGARLERVCT